MFFDEHIILPMMTNMGIVHRDLFALPSVTRKKMTQYQNTSLLLSNNSLISICFPCLYQKLDPGWINMAQKFFQ